MRRACRSQVAGARPFLGEACVEGLDLLPADLGQSLVPEHQLNPAVELDVPGPASLGLLSPVVR